MWHHYFQRASLRAGFGAHRAGSVFLFVAKQRHPVAACVLPVLRRPAHHRGVASASALHGKNSSTGVCSSAQSRKSLVAPATLRHSRWRASSKPIPGARATRLFGSNRGVPVFAGKCQSRVNLSIVAPGGQPSNQVPLQSTLNARLTNRSTGHFVACRVWAKKA